MAHPGRKGKRELMLVSGRKGHSDLRGGDIQANKRAMPKVDEVMSEVCLRVGRGADV